jgi:hypothetical protein
MACVRVQAGVRVGETCETIYDGVRPVKPTCKTKHVDTPSRTKDDILM